MMPSMAATPILFLSTLSLRRATRLMYFWPCGLLFLSTLSLRRATGKFGLLTPMYHHFYPRSPCGERPLFALLICPPLDFYPRSPCGERPILHTAHLMEQLFLSTLSLRRATAHKHAQQPTQPISIHALLAESDFESGSTYYSPSPFLSTLSLRRATVEEVSGDTWARDFYPRSPCGERLTKRLIEFGKLRFLSTLSLRRATTYIRDTAL